MIPSRPAIDDRLADVAAGLRDAARRAGTPCYVTDVVALEAAADRLAAAFPDPWLRAYSLEANDAPAIVARLAGLGLAANVVSLGEWSLASRAGVANGAITLGGIGKGDAELRAAARAAAEGRPLRWVTVESAEEAAALARSVARLARRPGSAAAPVDVLLRVNPGVEPETHAGLATVAAASKFGLTPGEVTAAIEAGGGPGGPLRWRGLSLHVGSQLGAVDGWRDAVRRVLALFALLRGGLPSFDTVGLGGGFPVADIGLPVPGPERFAAEVPALLAAIPVDRRPTRLAVEPGRFLVARAGWIVARVLHVRDRSGPPDPPPIDRSGPLGLAVVPPGLLAADRSERIVVIDAGMTELVRPALYGASHGVVALTSRGRIVDHRPQPIERTRPSASWRAAAAARREEEMAHGRPPPAGSVAGMPGRPALLTYRVDGPVCESTDTFGEHRLPPQRRGDLVAVRDAGAYGASMSSRYNGRPRPAEVILEGDGRVLVARRRAPLRSLA